MDQRRLFLFLTLCFLLLIAFGPKPKPVENPDAKDAAEQVVGDDDNQGGEAVVADEESQAKETPPAEEVEAAPLVETEVDLEFVTLGSVDPDSPYRMAITLTNQGAALRRLELSSPRFRDVHDRSGYFGHLELTPDDAGGLRVQSVVAGTPAALAGIEVGDRILSFTAGGEPTTLESGKQLSEATSKLKPKQTVTLQVARGEEAAVDREITLARRPLEVIRPEIENVLMRTDELPQPVDSPPSFLFTFEQLGPDRLPSAEELKRRAQQAREDGEEPAAGPAELPGVGMTTDNWEIAQRDETSVTFVKRLPKYGLEVEKRYSLQAVPDQEQDNHNYPGYDLTLDTVVRNLGDQEVNLRYRLDGPNGLPLEGWWYAHKVGREWTVGIRDVISRHVSKSVPEQFGASTITEGETDVIQGNPLAYAGIDAQYFSVMMLPKKPRVEDLWIDELRCVSLSPKPKARSNDGRFANVTCRLISQPQQLAPGESLEHSYEIFAGPKRPDLLENYHASESTSYGLSDLMYYGWFSSVSRLMLWILHVFYGLVGNYGIAIIMLTVLVRGCLFPLSRKQAQSMAKMQELRPEMDKIKEKYKNDLQKQSQAQQELYRKHEINPLAGCLPLFIQMPIFLGLYRALMVDVELRQAPLLGDSIRWCSNLAAPDMLYDWSWFMPDWVNRAESFLVGLGPYLNVLPLVTAGLFLLQQKMFMTEPANEQMAMQQKVMKYMMLVMGLLFFKVAAGLCIYFIASSVWAIVERKMLPKPTPSTSLATDSGPSPSTSPARSSKRESAPRKRNKKKKKR